MMCGRSSTASDTACRPACSGLQRCRGKLLCGGSAEGKRRTSLDLDSLAGGGFFFTPAGVVGDPEFLQYLRCGWLPQVHNKFIPVPVTRASQDAAAASQPRSVDVIAAMSAAVTRGRKKGRSSRGSRSCSDSAAPSSAAASRLPSPLVQLSRLTIRADAARNLGDLYPSNPQLRGYDLVAVAPGARETGREWSGISTSKARS